MPQDDSRVIFCKEIGITTTTTIVTTTCFMWTDHRCPVHTHCKIISQGIKDSMFRQTTPKMNALPANAKVLPWFLVFLILFACVSLISLSMAFLESRNAPTPSMIVEEDQRSQLETNAPARLLPETVQRRYDVPVNTDRRPLHYLYSWSKDTRQSNN